mmetsp:Transcript_49206/g.157355  ORF Transcript_49206/g.157355 Transcript_49206/m.157355 type:complete len:326 (+) Transcript_49206:108-1085(+)
MTSAMVANVGSAIAMFLAFLWMVVVCVPLTWVCSQSVIVNFQASLLTVKATKGTLTSVLGFAGSMVGANKFSRALDKVFDQNYWMEEGVQEFSGQGLELLFHWRHTWTAVKFSSWAMVFCGLLAAALLALGGSFMYYYTHHHATHTGRLWIRICFLMAPTLVFFGLAQYIAMTMDFGKGANMHPPATNMYSGGFVVACALALLSWLPLYMQAVFSKKAENEKYGDSEQAAEGLGPGYAGGYGATGAGPYGAPPGAFAGPQSANAFSAQAPGSYMPPSAPGMGVSAYDMMGPGPGMPPAAGMLASPGMPPAPGVGVPGPPMPAPAW